MQNTQNNSLIIKDKEGKKTTNKVLSKQDTNKIAAVVDAKLYRSKV